MRDLVEALRAHWPEYVMEAAGLGLFMVSAAVVTTALEYPHSPLHTIVPDAVVRRLLIGLCMGGTAIALIYSPWGQQSGAHLNPAVTMAFFRLGKIRWTDACFYMVAQCLGGVAGLLIAAAAIGMAIEDPRVNYVVTAPGFYGTGAAFAAELLISFVLMSVVLIVSNQAALNAWTGLIAGCLVALYITVEAPLSGMSMNPARSLASALPAHVWRAFWIYLTAPLLGMLLAGECYVRARGAHAVLCAKLHHQNDKRCIFRCGYGSKAGASV
ncbi:MIP/aquaporin family protein [Nitrospira moscoviensis]|uniref:Major intrinsic protein n=1 Tax=Nitrospira moscoviensis TaxID=42253 RepID=A0A0K2GHI4_NITMO|nr:aquaporin [Nitrospira moscoviensis]ALA60408.1 Major intrinsic protein [Nitrospira moscoviensis]